MAFCHGCGCEKAEDALEVYPWPDEDGITDNPIDPFFQVDCNDRVATVCHTCFHRLSPDMWINRQIWESIKPVTPFESLPFAKKG